MDEAEILREARYNPTPNELSVLVETIDEYFTYPDRSDQRRHLVNEVTNRLYQINSRWSVRRVRLWFNNNKKYRTRPTQNVTFNWSAITPSSSPDDQGQASLIPLKKREKMRRSQSVDHFPSNRSTDSFVPLLLSTDDQKRQEKLITELLIQKNDENWKFDLSFLKPGIPNEFFRQETYSSNEHFHNFVTLKSTPCVKVVKHLDPFECCCFTQDGVPLICHFDSEKNYRILSTIESEYQLFLQQPITSIAEENQKCYFVSGKSLFAFSTYHFEIPQLVVPLNTSIIFSSTLAISDSRIYVGNRTNLFSIPKESPNYQQTMLPELRNITSLSSLSSNIAVASDNHPSIYVLNHELLTVSILSTHAGGISSIASLNDYSLISGGTDFLAYIWDLRTHSPVMQLNRHAGAITFLYTHCSNSKIVFTGSEDKSMRVFDLRSDQLLSSFHMGDGIPDACYFHNESSIFYLITKEMKKTSANGFRYPSQPNCTTSMAANTLLRAEFSRNEN